MPLIDSILSSNLSESKFFFYISLFFLVGLESIPFLGLLIPGIIIAISAGILSKIGIMSLYLSIFLASIAAISGDLISYYLGKKYGKDFLLKIGKKIKFEEKNYNATSKLFKKHAIKALFFGRFYSFTRGFAPFIAGSSNLCHKKFFLVTIITGFFWGGFFVIMGHLSGLAYEKLLAIMGKVTIICIFILCSLICIPVYFYYKKNLLMTNI